VEPAGARPVVVERRSGGCGELVLRRAGEHLEIIAGGTFLMDTRDGRSERALVREALAGLSSARLLLGGLGVGFSLDEALASPALSTVTVVEAEQAIVDWAHAYLPRLAGRGLADPRTRLVVADVVEHLRRSRARYDAVCLDVDNGPDWLSRPGNAALYEPRGLALFGRRLRPGGRLAVWASAPSADFAARLGAAFASVRCVRLAVARGPDDAVYVASDPRA
jgi:spermidine synthase